MLDYDPFSEAVKDDPYPVYARLRNESPVHYVGKYDCWAISRFEDVWNLSMDRRLSVARGTTPGQLLTKVQPVTPMLNVTDPPDHTRLRQALRRFFTPGRVARLEPVVREAAAECMARGRERGELDVCTDFASRVAVKTTCTVVGFPFEDADLLKGLVDRFFAREEGVDGMTADGLAAAVEINDYFVRLVRERRAKGGRRDDAVDVFTNIELEGGRLPDEALGSHLSMLLIGGSETFPKVFANLVKRLAEHPDARAACARDPSLVPDAFTEGLRIDMPTQFLGRTLIDDVELRGVTMRAGQVVLFLYPAANRDAREFDDPDAFDIRRRPERILSFGSGTHACIGMHVARLEGRICTEVLLEAWPGYALHLDRADRLRTEFVQGYMALPVTPGEGGSG